MSYALASDKDNRERQSGHKILALIFSNRALGTWKYHAMLNISLVAPFGGTKDDPSSTQH